METQIHWDFKCFPSSRAWARRSSINAVSVGLCLASHDTSGSVANQYKLSRADGRKIKIVIQNRARANGLPVDFLIAPLYQGSSQAGASQYPLIANGTLPS